MPILHRLQLCLQPALLKGLFPGDIALRKESIYVYLLRLEYNVLGVICC